MTFFILEILSLSRYWITIEAGDPLIGNTVWIFKNSWGDEFGDAGYVYVETPLTNIGSTYAIKTPFTSIIQNYNVICEDRDGDGYYWWGLGEKPATCNGPDQPDGDDSDPTLGPLDEFGNCIPLNTIPVADFTNDKTKVNIGEYITFSDKTSGNPGSWNWSFEGGSPSTSNVQNPKVRYDKTGVFNVSLIVNNANGWDTITKENLICVTDTVIADFTVDKTSITTGETVTFSDHSSVNTTSWHWIFDGGTPATTNEKNPTVQYNEHGVFNVSLIVNNATGSDTLTKENIISVKDLVTNYCVSAGNATDEWIANVQMGANSNASGAGGYEDFSSVVFSFEAGKTYNLALEPGFGSRNKFEYWSVWMDFNQDMDFDDAGEQIFVASKNRSTVTGIIAIPANISINTRMRIAVSRSGIPPSCGSIDYGEVEDYTVHIGAPVPQPPVAEFKANLTDVIVGEPVQFTDLSTNSPAGWQWSFPGGTPSTSTEKNPVVSYSSPGIYDVSLIVTKDNFQPSVMQKTNYMVVNENVPAEYCLPAKVNSSSDFITHFTINGVLNHTTAAESFSVAATTVSLAPGQDYGVSMSPWNDTDRNYWKIWIDFNDDGDFTDSGENVLAAKNKRGTYTSSIAIPINVEGTRRMRLSMRTGSDVEPCDDNFDGEVEDYLVSFAPQSMVASSAPVSGEEWNNPFPVQVFPNPVKDKLYVRLGSNVSSNNYVLVALFDANGKKLVTRKVTESFAEIDFQSFAPGLYVVEIIRADAVFREKIMKR